MVQFVLMVGAIVSVLILGVLSLDSPSRILQDADDGGRLILFE